MNPVHRIAHSALTEPARRQLQKWVLGVIRSQGPAINFDEPKGEPGLFGPESVTWRIHADFPGMMAGGIAALMLQTLHPLALSGVWDHSAFRTDILGRLRRTTAFVAGTTYAPRDEAEQLIARVRAIHEQVRGTADDGRPYAANDPRLLTWVHVTEMSSFLRGYQRYRGVTLPRAVQDRYYDETRRLAEALGAREVPRSAVEVDDYYASVQTELRYSERSREVLAVLAAMRLPIPLSGVSRQLFLGAGASLLPEWALRRIGRSRVQRLRDAAAARSLLITAPLLRAALRDGIGARSCQRVGLDTSELHRTIDSQGI